MSSKSQFNTLIVSNIRFPVGICAQQADRCSRLW